MVTGVGVGERIVGSNVGVAVGVKTGVAVPVEDGIAIDVAVGSAGVSAWDGNGSTVGDKESFVDVKLADGKGNEVGVDESDVPVGEGIGGEPVVLIGCVAVIEIRVLVGVVVPTGGTFAGIHKSRQININNKMIATISLNKS